MVQVLVAVAGGPPESTTVATNVAAPPVAVPIIDPVEAFRVKPGGSDPTVE
jgi:hypothetical protein